MLCYVIKAKTKVYNDVSGRLYVYHTTETANNKKEGDINYSATHRQNVTVVQCNITFLFLQF